MAEYKTEQKKLLLEFLESNRDRSFTVEEIERGIIGLGVLPPGKSTIYRLLSKLSEAGAVNKFASERGALYQLKGGQECERHLHMKCTECGKILHMSDNMSRELLEEIFDSSSFSVDREKTVLLGKCEKCKNI